MPAPHYKIWAIGSPVGLGVTQSIYVGVSGVAKSNIPGPSTTVANELVCNRLASALLLPVPPGFLIEHNSASHFVSLDFNLAGNSLPPVDTAVLVGLTPELCWGITLFDMWVGNPDRHDRNIAHDTTTNRVQIFDHSHALLGHGFDHFKQLSMSTGLHGHCLRTELKTLSGFKEWRDRILSIPEYYIRSIVSDIADPKFGVSEPEAQECVEILLARRTKLTDIAKANSAEFPKIVSTEWNSV